MEEVHEEAFGSPVDGSFSCTPSARANGLKKEFRAPLSPSDVLDSLHSGTLFSLEGYLKLQNQATAMLEAVNRAVEGGLFYAPIATCSEEAADFASQKIELPSLEWFQLPEAPPGQDFYDEISDLGPKRRPVQESVKKNKESDIQLQNQQPRLLKDQQQQDVANRCPITAQVAHMNEDLVCVQEEIAYLISGTHDVEVALAIEVQTTKDTQGRYQDPHLVFFACSYHAGYVVHHGGIDFGLRP